MVSKLPQGPLDRHVHWESQEANPYKSRAQSHLSASVRITGLIPAFYMEARHSGKEYIQGGKKRKRKITLLVGEKLNHRLVPRLSHTRAREQSDESWAGEARKN